MFVFLFVVRHCFINVSTLFRFRCAPGCYHLLFFFLISMASCIRGMKISFTRLLTMALNAVAMITPIAMSMTLPFRANFLNSSINFFISATRSFHYSGFVLL